MKEQRISRYQQLPLAASGDQFTYVHLKNMDRWDDLSLLKSLFDFLLFHHTLN